MDSDTSRLNSELLRAERNSAQLEKALQAEQSREYQQQLLFEKREYENQIRHYEGCDPLHYYYQYISWLQRSFSGLGEVGNFSTFLYHCLSRFLDDVRYMNDRRFCKIWIIYNDMQENPVEIYKWMYSKGICKGCADMYKAWAHYYESVGDVRSANEVFETGKREGAQPYDELNTAHQNMVFATGLQVIHGPNEKRLKNEKQALTSLQVYSKGTSSGDDVPTVTEVRSYFSIQISNGESKVDACSNTLRAVNRDITKESFKKSGGCPSTSTSSQPQSPKTSKFSGTVDNKDAPEVLGIQLPKGFVPQTREDFSDWKSEICVPDPEDPTQVPMYCKQYTYIDLNTEYSLEEVRMHRRHARNNFNNMSVSYMDTDPTTPNKNDATQEVFEISNHMLGENVFQRNDQLLLGSGQQVPDEQNRSHLQQLKHFPPKLQAQEMGDVSQNRPKIQQLEVVQLQDQASPIYTPRKNVLQNHPWNTSSKGSPNIQSLQFLQHQYTSPFQTPTSQKVLPDKKGRL